MKIATWNVNSIRTRQTHVKNWLKANPVDVLCLQETKVIDQDFPRQPFEDIGYNVYISGQKAYNGVAIFSQTPLEDVIIGFTPIVGADKTGDLDEQKRVISGAINDIRIVNLYVPNGASVGSEKYDYKLRWLEVLGDYLQQLREKTQQELCVCGDFNIALSDQDIYKPKPKTQIMASPTERDALQTVLSRVELQDAFRKFTEESGHYTWWDYRRGGFTHNRGWRIDHHYLTPNLYKRAVSCTIDIEPRRLEKPSDHTPAIAEI
ncbi:exodeoxyribonuclease III [Spirulina sp. CS-785/01]|uniref:exodeoxyribonuclease III n=1 Tax=Spirulina sp. CS-785/01 TaxID=3021716 RepID=UPI00232B411F|nr:exodeoxyribonuclease III [Spirulina sp. CS-785/01]MDB9314277.1 exodeoxyribonuclease III [Spirulina sp. CS-785/01]